MKYLCLVYGDEALLHSLPDSPKDPECHAYAEAILGSGRMLAAEALESVSTATTVRRRNGKLSITDGPFAETKDLIAGWMIIDVESKERAIELAGELSAAPGAGGRPIHEWLEVRPFLTEVPNATD